MHLRIWRRLGGKDSSPGHICIYSKAKKVVFAGDHLLGDITPNPGDPAFGSVMRENSLEYFLDSLNKLKRYDIERAFPAHGEIVEDPIGRVEDNVSLGVFGIIHCLVKIISRIFNHLFSREGVNPLA